MLKAIATLAVVAPLGMAHVTPAPCPQQNSDRVVAFSVAAGEIQHSKKPSTPRLPKKFKK
jgi:hypothetical protein